MLYAKIPYSIINDEELPSALFRTLAILLREARQYNYWHTPKYTVKDFQELIGGSERRAYGHLCALRELVHCRVESPQRGHIVVWFPQFAPKEAIDRISTAKDCSESLFLGVSSDTLDLNNHDQEREEEGFLQKSAGRSASQAMFRALASVCKYNLDTMTDKQRGKLNQAEKRLREAGSSPSEMVDFETWWYQNDWRGKKGQAPEPHQIREEYDRFKRGGAVRLKVVPGHCPKCGGKAEGRFCPECSLHW